MFSDILGKVAWKTPCRKLHGPSALEKKIERNTVTVLGQTFTGGDQNADKRVAVSHSEPTETYATMCTN